LNYARKKTIPSKPP